MSRFALTIDTQAAREKAARWCMKAPFGMVVQFLEDRRTNEQNRLLWPLLTEISQQVTTDGVTEPPENWKAKFMSALGHEVGFTRSLDGKTFIPLGHRSSHLTKKEFSDLLELIFAYGAEKGVVFARQQDAVMKEAA